MYICFICGKPVEDKDEFIWHGLDGDKIHANCCENKQRAYDKINNMSDNEFKRYLLGKRHISDPKK